MRPSPAGFTLIELLLVLVVLATFAALVAPRMSGSLSAARAGRGAVGVFAVAREGRAHAVLRGLRTRLVLDAERGTFWLEEERRPLVSPGVWTELTGREGEPYALPEGARFDELLVNDPADAAALPEIRFLPDGSSDDARVTIATDGGDSRAVEIRGITGHARIVPEDEEGAGQRPVPR